MEWCRGLRWVLSHSTSLSRPGGDVRQSWSQVCRLQGHTGQGCHPERLKQDGGIDQQEPHDIYRGQISSAAHGLEAVVQGPRLEPAWLGEALVARDLGTLTDTSWAWASPRQPSTGKTGSNWSKIIRRPWGRLRDRELALWGAAEGSSLVQPREETASGKD